MIEFDLSNNLSIMAEDNRESLLETPKPSRYSTFSRNYSRALTFDGLGRTLTGAFSFLPDSEDQWVAEMYTEYVVVSKKGAVDGDVPLPGGFAKELRFFLLMNLRKIFI